MPGAAGKEIAKDTAVGAVGGAATGGTAGAVHGAAKQIEPSEKSYEVVGWQ